MDYKTLGLFLISVTLLTAGYVHKNYEKEESVTESEYTTIAECTSLAENGVTVAVKECFDDLSKDEFATLLDNPEAHELFKEAYDKFGEPDPDYDPSVWDDA